MLGRRGISCLPPVPSWPDGVHPAHVSVAVEESRADPLTGCCWPSGEGCFFSQNDKFSLEDGEPFFYSLEAVGESGAVFSGRCLRVVDGDQ